MSFYHDQLLPRAVDWALSSRECMTLRARVSKDLRGRVLEIGFGSGLNLLYYPDTVEHVYAVDPAVVGRTLAADRIATCPAPVEFIGLDGQALPLGDASVDTVLSTWTLCTIPDASRALAEVRRVLKPGGRFYFLEHGRSFDPSVARWQDRLNPVQKFLFGGCQLNRQMDRLVRDAGFALDRLENFYMNGPRVAAFMYEGVATRR